MSRVMVHGGSAGGTPLRRGRYRLMRRVGRGGMGEVWQACIENAHGVQSFFAVKLLHPEVSDKPDHRTMLIDEARIASRIQSPNIARVIEIVEDEHGLCLVMEWIDGTPLSRVVADGPLPLGVALRIAADICAGLHAAHELEGDDGKALDVIHRDVSPQNVLIDRSGVTKVVDFGIAKAKGRLAKETTSGVKGKARYMSVEQARAAPIDRRADVFAVGVVLYEMLTGEHPFGAHDDLSALVALSSQKPATPLPSSIPAVVSAIVRRALAHDRAKRFPTALAMRTELEAAMVDCNVTTDTPDVARAVAARPAVTKHRSIPAANEVPASAPEVVKVDTVPARRGGFLPVVWVAGAAVVLGAGVLIGASGIFARPLPASSAAASVTTSAPPSASPPPEPPPSALDLDMFPLPATTDAAVATARPHPTVSASAPSTSTSAPASRGCDPPWYVDSAGHRVYSKDCLRDR